MTELIGIDGSYLEGGGQIVRTALALSALTGSPFKVKEIRKGRPKPGLKPQHMNAIDAIAGLCSAKVKGNEPGSETLEFVPGKLEFRNLNIDIGTAGSITLLLEALLPLVIFSDRQLIIKIRGGTDTEHSIPIDYLTEVFLPFLRPYAEISANLDNRGYYPKGGGKVILRIKPKYAITSFKSFLDFFKYIGEEEKGIDLSERGSLLLIRGISHASKDLMNANVAERQAKSARFFLAKYNVPAKIDAQYSETLSTGSGITLMAVYSGNTQNVEGSEGHCVIAADCLGERGKKAEKVGEEAAQNLAREIEAGGAADEHLTDQLMPYLGLFGGKINACSISDHAKTNMYIIEKFLPVKFKVDGRG